jgi:hypothetical protein
MVRNNSKEAFWVGFSAGVIGIAMWVVLGIIL